MRNLSFTCKRSITSFTEYYFAFSPKEKATDQWSSSLTCPGYIKKMLSLAKKITDQMTAGLASFVAQDLSGLEICM